MEEPEIPGALEELQASLRRVAGGVAAAWKESIAFRIGAVAAAILVPYAWTLRRPLPWKGILLSVILPVLAVQLLGMALPEGPRKNLASAAALLMTINAALVWWLMLG